MWLSLFQLIICKQLYQHVQCELARSADKNDTSGAQAKELIELLGRTLFRGIQSDVYFELYTRQHPTPTVNSDEFIKYFRADHQTKIVIHGYQSDTQSELVQSLKNNYLQSRDCNVIGKIFAYQFRV